MSSSARSNAAARNRRAGGADAQPQNGPGQQPDYNSMYQNNNTSMPGAASPGMEGMGQGMIMAANEVLGGSGFGSAW